MVEKLDIRYLRAKLGFVTAAIRNHIEYPQTIKIQKTPFKIFKNPYLKHTFKNKCLPLYNQKATVSTFQPTLSVL